ncbi:MAG: aldehyde dehydrogenase family protein [Phycisphaerae bacterium]|nr:aldehyde dehydrogenase family protein [Phycisphaerae bacterium]
MSRLPITKTCKLLINGAFPRSESGRSLPLNDAKGKVVAAIAHASRKDLRDAVEVANAAQPKWAAATAYNRGQILYRMAEMMEARRSELVEAIRSVEGGSPNAAVREVDASIDRVVRFAGWTDKIAQVLGNQNPVAGPYYNFSVPEPTGTIVTISPDAPSLLGLVTLACAPLSAGNAVIAIASDTNPLPAVSLMEIVATSDVPAGVLNILTGRRAELLEHIASHRDIGGVSAALTDPKERRTIQLGVAENLKRVHLVTDAKPDWTDDDRFAGPWSIEPFLETKTIWHPSAV